MVRTYGLTHINLAVRDAKQSLHFYRQVFGVEEYGRGGGLVHARTPGCHDVITFDAHAPDAGESRGTSVSSCFMLTCLCGRPRFLFGGDSGSVIFADTAFRPFVDAPLRFIHLSSM